jgi:hypothetical protein
MAFLDAEGRQHQFIPCLKKEDLLNPWGSLTINNFYLLMDTSGIVATGALWDQQPYKQYIVCGFGGVLKLLYPILRLLPLPGYPKIIRPGSPVDFATLSFWAVKNNEPVLFDHLLSNMAAAAKPHAILVVGLHERNRLKKVFNRRLHLRYRSRLYLVHPKGSYEGPLNIDKSRIPYLECGRL